MRNIYKTFGKGFIMGLAFVPAVTASCIITAGVLTGVGKSINRRRMNTKIINVK